MCDSAVVLWCLDVGALLDVGRLIVGCCPCGRVAYLGDMQFSASLLRLVSKPMNPCKKSLRQRLGLFDSAQMSGAASRAIKLALPGRLGLIEVPFSQVGEHPMHPRLDSREI